MKKQKHNYAPKPSDAVFAMVNGLIKQSNRKDFKVNMETYGTLNPFDNICFGCAATCAIQELTGKNLHDEAILDTKSRAEYLKLDLNSLDNFERMINHLRCGNWWVLEKFYSIEIPAPVIQLPILDVHNWREDLEPYEIYAEQLKAAGL